MIQNSIPGKILTTLKSSPDEHILGYCALISAGSWDPSRIHMLSGRNALPHALCGGQRWEVFLFFYLLSFGLIGIMLRVASAPEGRAQVAVQQSHWRLNLLQRKVELCLFGPFRTRTSNLFYTVGSLRISQVASMDYGVSLWEVAGADGQFCNISLSFFVFGVNVKHFTALKRRIRKHPC